MFGAPSFEKVSSGKMNEIGRKALQFGWMFLACILTCATAFAQSEPEKPGSGVDILKLKWEKQIRPPRNFDPSVIPTNGVFTTMESRTNVAGSTQAPYGDEARRDAAARSAALAPVDYFPNVPSRLPFSYLYSLMIRNVGTKTVQAVAWDYLFLNRVTQEVVGDHHFLSYVVAKPGRKVTLKVLQRARPVTVLSASGNADRNKSTRMLERAIIECVMYDDETTWWNPAARNGICDLLKQNKPATTHKASNQRSR